LAAVVAVAVQPLVVAVVAVAQYQRLTFIYQPQRIKLLSVRVGR